MCDNNWETLEQGKRMYRFVPAFIMNTIKYSRHTRDIFGKVVSMPLFDETIGIWSKRISKELKNVIYYLFVKYMWYDLSRFWNEQNIVRFCRSILSSICAIILFINCETPDFFFDWNAIPCCRLQFNILFTDWLYWFIRRWHPRFKQTLLMFQFLIPIIYI